MDEDVRQRLVNEASKLHFFCSRHPQQVANMFITDDGSQHRGMLCGTCYTDILQSEEKAELQMKPLKFVLAQIHQSCCTLACDLPTSAFVDHHLTLIRTLAKNHLPHIQPVLQASVTNYFQKYRDFITGKYFQEFYAALAVLVALNKEGKGRQQGQERQAALRRIVDFALGFQRFIAEFDEYASLSLQEKITGQGIVRQIKGEISEVYREFREKVTGGKKGESLGEEIIQLFNPKAEFSKFFRFSPTLIHHSLKIVDPKKIKIPELPDNDHTLMALIEPAIGQQKKSIKFKMEGIKGWVSVGIAIRKKVEANQFKFESSSAHGSFQVSYDGYSWSEDSSVNEQYTSWYYNEGDTVTLTASPLQGELVYVRNGETQSAYTLRFKAEKKDKLYFCVSINYNEDCVSIVE